MTQALKKIPEIWVLDDEASILSFLRSLLEREGYQVQCFEDPLHFAHALGQSQPMVVITDLSMPSANGIEILKQVKAQSPLIEVILVTAYGAADTAVTAMKLGAFDYIQKPFNIEDIRITVRNALEKAQLRQKVVRLEREKNASPALEGLIGQSDAMAEVSYRLSRLADSHANVMIRGESGTGKELAARNIHRLSPRSGKPYVSVNCGAIPDGLLESEFFGHQKGAFTGASSDKKGLFLQAHEGTLFLDEVADLPLNLQVKLLRAIQEQRVRPLGSEEEITIDVRIIAATHKNLEALVKAGTFREDLYYRLNVLDLHMPALSERGDDVILLAHHFLQKCANKNGREPGSLDEAVMAKLVAYPFPGNVRELENLIEQSFILSRDGHIRLENLPPRVKNDRVAGGGIEAEIDLSGGLDLDRELEKHEKHLIEKALQSTGGVKKRAAKLLKISFRSMRYRLLKHHIK